VLVRRTAAPAHGGGHRCLHLAGTRPRPEPVDPDDALRSAAAERERALLREYDAVLAARPALAPRLTAVRAHHAEHLEALLGPPPSPSASPSASPAPTGAVPPTVPPADDASALARLVAAERAAGDAHAADCLAASRSLAPVLASLSASELSHPVALA
jgi:hypothetical protein